HSCDLQSSTWKGARESAREEVGRRRGVARHEEASDLEPDEDQHRELRGEREERQEPHELQRAPIVDPDRSPRPEVQAERDGERAHEEERDEGRVLKDRDHRWTMPRTKRLTHRTNTV